MLSVKALWVGDDGSYYLKEASEHAKQGKDHPAEYYPGGVPSGRWIGSGAGRLGLDGAVDGEAFSAVLAGRDPATGRMLVSGRAASAGRTPGYDLTFSAPKSVSLLSVLGDPAVGEQVRAAHRAAVDEAMRLVENEVAKARRGAGGARQVAAEVVAAAFDHHTSRANDPQLHTHVVVANMGFAADGRWSALHGRRLYAWAKTAGFVYQAALRAELTERLGVTWQPVTNGMSELQGFTKNQLRAFSARRAEIEAELERSGFSSARAAQLAAWETRAAKTHAPADQLAEKWRTQAAEAGITVDQVEALTPHRDPGRRVDLPPQDGKRREKVVGGLLAADGLTAHASSFDRRHVLQGAAQAAARGAHLSEMTATADQVLADPEAVELKEASKLGDRRYSTAGLLAVEQELLAQADRRLNAHVAVADGRALEAALSRRPSLSDEQHRMVTVLTTSGAGVQTVVGVAGAGKTFALDAAREAWEASGHRVVGAALAARAAAELQAGSGIASTTLDRLLIDTERPGPEGGLQKGGVVVVDEAGMVGTRKLARLLNLAEGDGAAVVLVGDPRQLPEVEAGGAFAALARRLPTVELTANRRQVEGWERAALAELRAGSVAEAVVAYRDHRRITVAATADGARSRLIGDWWDARAAGGGDARLAVYAYRRADVDDLNRRARLLMGESGRLEGAGVEAAGRVFQVGDEVLATRNDRRLGVRNGTLGRVVAVDVDHRTVTVDIDRGDETVLPAGYLDGGHLDYGYATTIHKAEGATVDEAFVLGSDALYREAGYTALSRARVRTQLYVVGGRQDLDDCLRPRNGRVPEVDPVDRLAGDLSRSFAQHLASQPEPPGHTDHRTIAETDGTAAPPGRHDWGLSLAELEEKRDRLAAQIGAPPPAPRDVEAAGRLEEARAWRLAAERRLDDAGRAPRRQRAAAQA
ncbi:MAG: MobF family relaxase, partial [Acidimicrobiales bacterium]